jgi:hypothetical protein
LGIKEPRNEVPNRVVPTKTSQTHRATFPPITKLQEVVRVYPKGMFPRRFEIKMKPTTPYKRTVQPFTFRATKVATES